MFLVGNTVVCRSPTFPPLCGEGRCDQIGDGGEEEAEGGGGPGRPHSHCRLMSQSSLDELPSARHSVTWALVKMKCVARWNRGRKTAAVSESP